VLPGGALAMHHSNSRVRHITDKPYQFIWSGVNETNNGCLVAGAFDHVKGSLVYGSPVKWHPILHDGQQWACVWGDIREEVLNVIHQSYKMLDIIIALWCSPVADTSHLVRIRMYSLIINGMSQTVNHLGI
jgi:hypothetical protein